MTRDCVHLYSIARRKDEAIAGGCPETRESVRNCRRHDRQLLSHGNWRRRVIDADDDYLRGFCTKGFYEHQPSIRGVVARGY